MGKNVEIRKSTGERVPYSEERLADSLRRSGAEPATVDDILQRVGAELFPGITTREIYNRAYALLRRERSTLASKYKLKKAIYELGPSGFPFEKFISAVLSHEGYNTKVNQIVNGKCVTHEIDVMAEKNGNTYLIECKFHNEEGINCDVKIPLYIHSRFRDVHDATLEKKNGFKLPVQGWVVTNTRFTQDALDYGNCAGLYLLSWDFPGENGLRNRIDRLGLYPITVSSLLSKKEKDFLLSREVVLLKQLKHDSFYLDHMGVGEERKKKILKEVDNICEH